MAATRSFNIQPDPYSAEIMQYTEEIWVPSAAQTANGNSGLLGEDYHRFNTFTALLDITARSGTTPTLDVTVQDSVDGVSWATVAAFAQQTAVGQVILRVAADKPFSRRLRVAWVVGGTTPNFTFNIQATMGGPT